MLNDVVDNAASGSYAGVVTQGQPGALAGDDDTSVTFGGGYVAVDRPVVFAERAPFTLLNGTVLVSEPDDIVLAGATSLVIGARDGGQGSSFMGGIDEVAVYDRALSASELGAHYLAGVSR